MRIVWSPTAVRRAEAAVACITGDRPLASAEWLDGLIRRVELLRELPLQGRVVPEWHEETVREIVYRPYRVIYEVSEDRIVIVTLSHTRELL